MYSALTLLTLLPALAFASPTPAQPLQKRAPVVYLHPAQASNLCLGLATGTAPGNDVPLYNVPCNTAGSSWEIQKGDNQVVRLAGTNFCMDAGSPPRDGGPAKLWTCLPGVPQQRWYYTDDNHIAITGGSVCMDYSGAGCGNGGCAPATKNCGPGQNQVFISGPPSGTPTGPSSTQSATSTPPPTTQGRQLHWNGDNSKCVSLTSRSAFNGATVAVQNCLAASDGNSQYQRWEINRGSGSLKLAGTNFCLDAGSNPANGVGMKIWDCYLGLYQQTWYYTDDNHVAITGGTQCLDLKREDGTSLQTWTCSGNNPQQLFTL